MENKTMLADGWMNRVVVAPDTLTHNIQKQSFPLSPPPLPQNKSLTRVADSKSHNPKSRIKKKTQEEE
jgi:hypothetical protein